MGVKRGSWVMFASCCLIILAAVCYALTPISVLCMCQKACVQHSVVYFQLLLSSISFCLYAQ